MSAPAAGATTATTAHRALVVDDNPVNSKLIVHMLARLGWQTVTATSGEAGLAALAGGGFSIVLLDLKMPRLTGEQTCRQIRAAPALRHLPVIAYTAQSMPDELARIRAVGFDGLLVKPVSFAQVKAVCEQAVGARAGADLLPG